MPSTWIAFARFEGGKWDFLRLSIMNQYTEFKKTYLRLKNSVDIKDERSMKMQNKIGHCLCEYTCEKGGFKYRIDSSD